MQFFCRLKAFFTRLIVGISSKFVRTTINEPKLITSEDLCIRQPVEIRQKIKYVRIKKDKNIYLINPSHRIMVLDILDFYGYPVGMKECITKDEKIMHMYGLVAVLQALKKDPDLADEAFTMPREAMAAFFCREYHKKHGYHAIPTESDIKNPEVFNALKIGNVEKDEDKKQDANLDTSHPKEKG